jgi:integrase
MHPSYTAQKEQQNKLYNVDKRIGTILVVDSMALFSTNYKQKTAQDIRSCFYSLHNNGVIPLDAKMSDVARWDHQEIIERIYKAYDSYGTAVKLERLYVTYLKYCSRLTEGLVTYIQEGKVCDRRYPKNHPRQIALRMREKLRPNHLNPRDWKRLITCLKERGMFRERLLAIMMLHTGQKLAQILRLNIEDIDFQNRIVTIRAHPSSLKQTAVYAVFPVHILDEIRQYLNGREYGPVFIAYHGFDCRGLYLETQSMSNRLRREGASIGIKLNATILRNSCITYLKSIGYTDEDVEKIVTSPDSSKLEKYTDEELRNNRTREYDITKQYQRAVSLHRKTP